MKTLCVECGPNVRIDSEGCCYHCGGSASGTWLESACDPALHPDNALAAVAHAMEKERADLRSLLDEATRTGIRLADLECSSIDEDVLKRIRITARLPAIESEVSQ